MVSRRFLKFLVVGGIAASVNFGSRIVLNQWMGFVPAILVAYLFGMTTAFTLNKLFVFSEATNKIQHQAGWFIMVNLVAVGQTLVISLLLAEWIMPAMHWTYRVHTFAHGIGVLAPVVTSYFGHKYFSFKIA